MHPSRTSRRPSGTSRRLAALVMVVAALVSAPGCIVAGLVGGMAESAHRAGSTNVPAEYTGLAGKSYAVVVSADRLIEADNPGISARLVQSIDRDLHASAGASHHIPPQRLLAFLYANPQWEALPRGQLGEMLGVERLVLVELVEYRLHEPGNRYTWAGVASGIIQVFEIDSGIPDDPMYEQAIAVGFPDRAGVLEEEMPQTVVTSELSRRFAERAAWLFYTHKEPNELPY